MNLNRHVGGGEKGIHLEVTRNGDEEECNRGSGKGGEDEMRRAARKGREAKGREGKERR